MQTPLYQLPSRPSLDHLKYQARDLRKAFQRGDVEAVQRMRAHVHRLADLGEDDLASAKVTTGDAQLVIAREYGFASWRALKSHVDEVNASAGPEADANAAFPHDELVTYFAALRDRDLGVLQSSLDANPGLTEARINEGGLSLRSEAFEAELRPPLSEHSRTAVHHAANFYFNPRDGVPGHTEIVRLLLEHGADPNTIGFDGNNGHCAPIVIAAWEGGMETMRLLLEAGADVSGEQGIAALSTAASHDATDRFDLLVEYGAQASAWMLVRAGLSDRVLALVDEDSGLLSQTDDEGYTLLQAAARRMKYDGFERLPAAGRRIAEALIERGAEVDAFSAAALNDVERLRSLLQEDPAQANEPVGDGNTAVNMAVQARSNDALRVLLEAGATAEVEALRWAARMDYTDACRLLLEHGAEVTDEVTLAATWRNQESACLELVLASGGNPNAVEGGHGRGTLHWVASNPQAVQLLIDAGADVNMRAPAATDNTPLHHAIHNADSTGRLLEAGADPTLTNANGDTPLDLAARDGEPDVVELLQTHVDTVTAVTSANDAFTHEELVAWFTAFGERDLDAMRACLEANPALTEAWANDKVVGLHGEALDAALREPLTDQSSTAIHLAANNYLDRPQTEPPRGTDAIRLLLDYGADPDAIGFNENTGHCTAIVIAAWIGGARQVDPTKDDPEKLRLLLEAGADATGEQGIAALETAASHDRINHFDLLVEYGAPSSPWILVRAGLTDRVLAAVDEEPVLLTRRDEQGYTILQATAQRMYRDDETGSGRTMARALIERGAEVDVFTAAALNDEQLLSRVLQTDPASVKERLGDGRTPVDLAVLAGSNATLGLLLDAGADPNGSEALFRAARRDNTEACRLLIEHGAEIDDRIVLSAAWRNGDSACLELVLNHGGNPNAVGGRGTLHWVAPGNPQSVQLLLDAGADANMRAPGTMKNTPLHHAANNADSTRALLAAGADPTLANANGDTPLDLARHDGAQEVIEVLEGFLAAAAQVRSANDAFTHEELVAWFDAIRDLDLEGVRALLDANPALTEARANDKVLNLRGAALAAALREPLTDRSSTAIHLAANVSLEPRDAEPSMSLALMRLLLEHGADPDAIGFNENTDHGSAIVIAAWVGGLDKLRVLLEAGADATGHSGNLALWQAANHGRADRVDLLVEHGATASPWLLVRTGLTERVVALVDEDPELLTQTDESGYTLMQAGAEQLNRNFGGMRQTGRVLIEALIERGAEVDVFTAAALNDVSRLGALLQSDPARANERHPDGGTPVDFAVRVHSRDTLAVLLESGADPNRNDPLAEAAGMDQTETCRILIEGGARVTDKAVHAAAWRNRVSACLELMLVNGGNPNASTNRAALHWVAAENPQSVQLLIDAGADVDVRAPGSVNNTPLHVAAANGNMDSTLRLLAAGADATLTNDNGDTPADLAQRAEAQEVARMLERHVDAPATPVSAHARGPLLPTHEFFVAVGQLDLERVRELLEEDPSLVDADVWGDASVDGSWGHGSGQGARGDDETARAVHFAAYKHAELLRLLIEYDADLDAHGYCENQYGMTSALVLACWEGDMETVRLLLEAGADPNNPGTPAASPIHCGGHLDLEKVELMVQYGARHDIFSAAAVGDLDEVKRLLTESPGSIDAPDPFQRRSPLGWAVHYGRDEVAEYLSDAGAKATPQELISLGRTDEIRQLVEDDPGFVNRREVGGRDNEDPPLIWALRGGQRELVEFLLSAGADPNMHGDWETPLSLACGDVDMATLLIDAGADVNLSMFPGWTMLSKAVHRRGFEVAELLLRRGAEIDRVAGEGGGRKGGRTALQVAVGECREPDSIDDCLEKLTFLFAHGADVNVLSDDGKTALDIQLEKAGQSRYNFPSPEIAELLREHGGRRSAELDS